MPKIDDFPFDSGKSLMVKKHVQVSVGKTKMRLFLLLSHEKQRVAVYSGGVVFNSPKKSKHVYLDSHRPSECPVCVPNDAGN
jgi:hypothetical protein